MPDGPFPRARRALRRGLRRLARLADRLWARIGAIAALALVAAGLSTLAGPFLPARLEGLVSRGAVEDLLDVIASSMLAVTIFSLSVMVTVHRAVEGSWTPRAHRLLARDHVTLSAVSVFLGGWLYALTAKILLDAALLGGLEHVFLFAMTVVVVLLIVGMVMRWVAHLATLGSLAQTGARLEEEARDALARRAAAPSFGGHPLTPGTPLAPGAGPVRAHATGWVREIDAAALEAVGAAAGGAGVPVYLMVPTGAFVARGEVIAQVPGAEARGDAVRAAVVIGDLRGFDDDPGYGLVALSEIAQRALSPGVNDPGTAIEIVGRMLRALDAWAPGAAGAPEHPHLWAPPLDAEAMLTAAFAPLARDGAGQVEVALALVSALGRLSGHRDPETARAAAALAEATRARAARALEDPHDRARLDAGPARPFGAAGPAREMARRAS